MILHEVQHAIQREEGFAKGANWDYWNRRMEDGYVPPQEKARQERVEVALQTIREIEATAPWDFLSRLQEYKYLENYIASEKGAEDTAAWDRAEAVQTELEEQYGELFQRWFDADWERQMAEGSRTDILPSTLYRNTAGEIEARDAAKRRTMTAEERRNTPPDLGDENTVFAEGDGTDASIGYDTANRPFVTVEEDILAGVDRKDWVRTVKENLRKKFPDGVAVGNNNIRINRQSRQEMTYSQYMKRLYNTDPEMYADKLRATNNSDEILKAAQGWVNEAPLHPRADDIADFARGEVQLRIGGKDYTAQVIVGNCGENGLLLYDVINLAPAAIQERTKKAGTEYTANAQDEPRSRGPAPTDKMIPHPEAEVNPQPDTSQASRKGGEDLRAQVERLARLNRRLKEETQRSGPGRPDREAVGKQAKSILEEYESGYSRARLTDRLEDLYRDFAAYTDGTLYERGKAPNMDQLRETARDIARDILAESATETNPLYEEYSELRKELRTRLVSVSGDVKQGMTEAWADFRKQNFGRLKLGNKGTSVDVLYDELSGRFPEFFPEDIISPADQLARLAEVAEELQSVTENRYEGEFDLNVEYLSGDLLERFYDTPNKPTFADKQARRLAEQRVKDREDRIKAVERQKERVAQREEKIAGLKEKHRRQNKERSENRTAAQRREQIIRHTKKLSGKLLKPTDKAHIPEDLRGAALSLLRSIDTGSGYETGLDGTRTPVGEGAQAGIPTKRTLAARELQAQYEKLAREDPSAMTIDPDLAGYLDEIAEMADKPLANMSRAELETVWKAVKAVETSVSQADKFLAQSRFATVSAMAAELDRDVSGRKPRSRFIPGIAQADGLLNLDMLTPETYLHKLGSAGDDLFRQMRRAQDRQTAIQADVLERFREVYEKSGLNAWKLEKDTSTFALEDGSVTLSVPQVMELYLLSGREQAVGHLLAGGIRPDAVKGKGLKLKSSQGAVDLTQKDILDITASLTPEQRALAEGMRDVMKVLAEYGNAESLAVYGYEKFKEKNYWPIKTSGADTATDPAAQAASKTIPGYGMTKQTKPNAKTPVVLHSAFDTFAQHVSEMSTYAAWLGTSENASRLLNYRYFDGDGNARGTVKDRLDRVHGQGGTAYLEKLLGDIAQGTKARKDTVFSSGGMTSAFKASAIAGNIRVVLQQPTAVLRAMEMISPKYFKASPNVMKGWETAKKYAPIAQWKDWGYFEMDTGRSYKDLMLGPEGALGKVNSALMSPAGTADAVGWGYLWNVVEAETAGKHPDLRRGSEEFYRAAARRFGEVIDRTQVVDSVLHRTQIMRSENALNKMASSFMSEPSKQYNELVRGVYDFNQAQGREAKTKAAGHIGRTAAAMSLSFALNAVAQSLADTWRDRDRDKDLEEKFREKWLENFAANYNPMGYVPYVKDLQSLLDGYDVGRMDMDVAADIIKAAGDLQKAWSGEGKKTKLAASMDALAQFCRTAGLPAETIKKDALGITGTVLQGLGEHKALYDIDKALYNIALPANRGQFIGHLYRAMDTNPEDYRAIYQDLLDSGMEADKIKDAMDKKLRDAFGLGSVTTLPFRWSPPGVDRDFDRLMDRAAKEGKRWTGLLPEGSVEAAQELDALGGDASKVEKVRKAAQFGQNIAEDQLENILSDKEWEQFRAARKAGFSVRQWADLYEDAVRAREKRTGKTGGAPSQEDVRAVLDHSGLSEAKKKAFWDSYGWEKEWGE